MPLNNQRKESARAHIKEIAELCSAACRAARRELRKIEDKRLNGTLLTWLELSNMEIDSYSHPIIHKGTIRNSTSEGISEALEHMGSWRFSGSAKSEEFFEGYSTEIVKFEANKHAILMTDYWRLLVVEYIRAYVIAEEDDSAD